MRNIFNPDRTQFYIMGLEQGRHPIPPHHYNAYSTMSVIRVCFDDKWLENANNHQGAREQNK